MTLSTTVIALRPRRVVRQRSRILRSPAALLSILWLVGLVLASATAPVWLPYGPLDQDLAVVLQGPSSAHWLGTDELGRDLLSRLLTAAAPTLLIALIVPVVAVAITLPLTLWAARTRIGETVMDRVSEVVLSLPGQVIILAFIAAIGTNMPVIMAVFGILLLGAMYRVFFGQAKSLHRQLFVEAAAVDGVRPLVASVRHVLPNMSTTIIVQFVLLFGAGIGMQAGLAFIGLGPQPPEPTWGGMVQAASKFIFQQPWLMIPTGGILALTIIAANTLADVLAGGVAMPPPLISIRRRRRSRIEPAESGPVEATPAALFPASSPAVEPAVPPLVGQVPPAAPDLPPSAPDLPGTELPGSDAVGTGRELVLRDLVIGVDGGAALVTGVSLRVKPGTVMGLVGESGCGKSVTSYATLGLLAPGLSVRSGSIMWDGVDLARADEKALQQVRGHEIAFISQEPTRALDPNFTVEWQLAAAIKRLRHVTGAEARTIAAELLEDVGIADVPRVLKSYPHQISGGMAQRVAISLALAGTPGLLIADEPTTALDVTVQAEILGLLRRLVAERGMSVVLVTHDLGVVADLCDEVSVMYAGEIVETGAVRDVLLRPEHPYTMALLSADPHAAMTRQGVERLATIAGQVPAPADWPTGCRFAARCLFARPECHQPIVLQTRIEGPGGVRCVRRDEVFGRSDEWLHTAPMGGAS